jgi:predicted ATP-binding protein involved in virulence
MKVSSRKLAAAGFLLVFCFGLATPTATAQGRMSDKDVEALLENLKSDAKKFRSSFDSAVGKSTIRGTSQEKDVKALVENFQKQTESAANKFKNDKKLDSELTVVLSSAKQIDSLLTSTPMGDPTNADWARVTTELSAVAKQFDTVYPAK